VSDEARSFLALLTLDQLEPDLFRGVSHEGAPLRAFGGQVAAHALAAAGATVDPGRPAHSLHSYFIRPGDPARPIDYRVERIRDGRSFTTRRITAVQHDEALFVLSASFHGLEDSPFSHRRAAPSVSSPADTRLRTSPRVQDPSDLDAFWGTRPFELRQVDPADDPDGVSVTGRPGAADRPGPADAVGAQARSRLAPARQQTWMRVREHLPDDQHTHACALVYMSDLTLAGTALGPHGGTRSGIQLTSLDHAVWFHRPFRADEWLLFDQASPTAEHARGLSTGELYTQDGVLVATVVQEALIRVPRRPAAD
jgi:acyl-CoA thioesterase-2